MTYRPPYTITPKILKLSQDIWRELGMLSGAKLDQSPIKLRRQSRIQILQASLAIEGNTLSIEQVTHLFEGKRIIGPPKDILEVKNAFEVYESITTFDSLSMNDLLKAHRIFMRDLAPLYGQWRTGGVGVYKGDSVVHIAPSAKMVPKLMRDLFEFINLDKDTPWLFKACIFHYELEFIHPFADGNGRMGRLWQQVLLMKEDPLFEYIPVEVLIKDNQERYYSVLSDCDNAGESTEFIEFSLEQILTSLKKYARMTSPTAKDSSSRLDYIRSKIKKEWFSRKEYMEILKNISSATASRDLNEGIEQGVLIRKGQKNQTKYQFKTN